jgi:phosphohistidine swiveling domain-containing protein
MPEVLKLGTISEEQVHLVGGKAYNLDKMIKSGLPVPPGFVITCESYDFFLENSNLEASIQRYNQLNNDKELKQLYKAVRDEVEEKNIPASLKSLIISHYLSLQSKSVAVRSSATNEDSKKYSFAGQFETYLNIQDEPSLLNSVVKCWASLWSERSLSYRLKNKDLRDSGKIAVVVQKMIPSLISGVIFTNNPVTQDKNQLLIEASWGLGEAIVSGKTMTDAFVVDIKSKKIIQQTINYKLNMSVGRDDGGIKEVKVTEDKRSLQTLNEQQVIELANLALRIRGVYQSEQDIEWAFDGQQFYILQSRPITTLEQPKTNAATDNLIQKQVLFTCLDIGESFTGVFTPLGDSFAKYYILHTHGAILSSLGLKKIGQPDLYAKFLFGRAYLDVSYFAYLYAQCIIFRDQSKFLERFASEEVDIKNYKNPYGKGLEGWEYIKSNIFYLSILIKDLITYKAKARKAIKERLKIYDMFTSLNLKDMTLYDLHQQLKYAYNYYHDSCVTYGPPYLGAFIFYDVLKLLSDTWLSKLNESVTELVKADASELRTTEVISAIEELAQEARQHPHIKQVILNHFPTEVIAKLQNYPEANAFLMKYQNLIRIHGVRSHQEMELTKPRWVDDPTYIFTTLKTYLTRDSYEIVSNRKKRNNERLQRTKQILHKLPVINRLVYQFVMNSYLKLSHLREEIRMCFIQGIWMNRILVFEVVRRLIEENVLHSEEEAAFITYDDILAYTAGQESAWQLFSREKIENNRRSHFINLHIPSPPLTFIGDWDPSLYIANKLNTDVLAGVGSSSGRITGKARIILDLEKQMEEFQPGEILVTSFTDTAWTPLFNLASAVVADIGSLLSHSSIVARELGIPCVVNAKIATQVIHTGDTIVVDGNEGKIYITNKSNMLYVN